MSQTLLSLKDWPEIQQLVIVNNRVPIARKATLSVFADGKLHRLKIVNPQPLDDLMALFSDCYELLVFDLNQDNGCQLEFGRYQIEVWDEDNQIARVTADVLEYDVVEQTN